MRRGHLNCFVAIKGFTLIETIIVITVLGIAAATIASLSSTIFFGQSDNRNMQVGVQLMQECAEQILATRRQSQSGYSAAPAPGSCDGMILTGFNAPVVRITDPSSTGCPPGGTCKLVSISQRDLTPIILLLVDY